jgi:hypothetical protein
MSIFGGASQDQHKLNGIPITSSKQGDPVTVVLGTAKVSSALLFVSSPGELDIGSGGKGVGASKSGDQWDYYADVQAALCNGPITGVSDVWAGQSWLQSPNMSEAVDGSSGGSGPIPNPPRYSPVMASLLTIDRGAGLVNSYSGTYSDYGLPSSTVLSGSDISPMVYVPYNYSLTPAGNEVVLGTGTYTINLSSLGYIAVHSSANASGGNTVYTLTASNANTASNGMQGVQFLIKGFAHAANNGTFICVASTNTTITLANASGVAETPSSGEALDVANVYHFSPSDIGKNAAVTYSYSLNVALIAAQVQALVPSGAGSPGFPNHTIVLSQQYNPTTVFSVMYYGEDQTGSGQTLTRVYSTPTVAGTYQVFTDVGVSGYGSNNTYVLFSAADVGNEVMVTWGYTNESSVGAGAPQFLNFVVYNGSMGQSPNSTINTGGNFSVQYGGNSASNAFGGGKIRNVTVPGAPGESLGYSGIAHADFTPMYLGTAGQMQDYVYEVQTPDAYGGGISDCNPIQCMGRVLTDIRWGLGGIFPQTCIDNGTYGTWGYASATGGTRSVSNAAFNWFAANSFFISPVIDSQEEANSVMGKWLEAGQVWGFMSEGLFKLVPLGSQSCAGNGCTWLAPDSFAAALDDTCFLGKEGEDRIKVTRKSSQDAYNKVQIDFDNRDNQYFSDIVQEWDQAAINRFTERLEDPQQYSFIHDLTAATFAASMRVKRLTGIWNEYAFQVPFAYSYLEPGDILEITTSSLWAAGTNNLQLGIIDLPVRVSKIVDNPDGTLDFTCEDYQAPALLPVIYSKSVSQGTTVNVMQQPGDTAVVMFEATSRMTGFQGNTIIIGACGESANWGGCNVLVSQDGSTYLQVGTIKSAARLGTLASNFGSGSDPDTVNTLVVTLEPNAGGLDAGTTTDADSGNTLCYVDDEIIAYSAASCTGSNQYTMGTYIRRGLMNSTIAAHSAGALFLRLDQSVFKYQYDPTWAGQTLYFKFQSFNLYGNAAQPLSSLAVVTFTVPGQSPGTVEAGSGLVMNTSGFNVGAGSLGWTPSYSGTI